MPLSRPSLEARQFLAISRAIFRKKYLRGTIYMSSQVSTFGRPNVIQPAVGTNAIVARNASAARLIAEDTRELVDRAGRVVAMRAVPPTATTGCADPSTEAVRKWAHRYRRPFEREPSHGCGNG